MTPVDIPILRMPETVVDLFLLVICLQVRAVHVLFVLRSLYCDGS